MWKNYAFPGMQIRFKVQAESLIFRHLTFPPQLILTQFKAQGLQHKVFLSSAFLFCNCHKNNSAMPSSKFFCNEDAPDSMAAF